VEERRGMEGEMWQGEWMWMWRCGDGAMWRCDGLSKRKSAKDHNDAMRWQRVFLFSFILCHVKSLLTMDINSLALSASLL